MMDKDGAAGQHLTEREILRLTKEALDQGRTKQQVFEELSPRFYSREHLAQLISAIPDVELRKMYTRTNQILIIMMVVTATSHLGLLLLGALSKRFLPFMLFNHIIPLLLLFFARHVRHMSPFAYTCAGGLSLWGTLDTVRLVRISPLWSFVDIALFATTAILSFHVGGHLFPHRGWTGPLKDENGNYVL